MPQKETILDLAKRNRRSRTGNEKAAEKVCRVPLRVSRAEQDDELCNGYGGTHSS
jgi:hypothetical protein